MTAIHLILWELALLLVSVGCRHEEPSDRICDSLHMCLAIAQTKSLLDNGVTEEEEKIAREIASYGRQAIPPLLDILNSERNSELNAQSDDSVIRQKGMKDLAEYAMLQMDAIPEQAFPTLKKLYIEQNKDEFLPVIARIESEEAMTFVLGHLNAINEDFSGWHHNGYHPDSFHTENKAIYILGERVLPLLIRRLYSGISPWDWYPIYRVLYLLGDRAKSVIPDLIEIAEDAQLPLSTREDALEALAQIGPVALTIKPRIEKLAEANQGALWLKIQQVLTDMGDPVSAAAQLADDLSDVQNEWETLYHLQDIADRRDLRRPAAGRAILPYLDNPDRTISREAIRALGAVRYCPGVSSLRNQLRRQDDDVAVGFAAESLGQLLAHDALDDLKFVAKNHWHSQIRATAIKVIRIIETGIPPESFSLLHESELFPDWKIPEPVADCPDARNRAVSADLNAASAAKLKTWVRHYPLSESSVLKTNNGWLIGQSRGEWGGELVFNSGTYMYKIMDGHVQNISLLKNEIVVTVVSSRRGGPSVTDFFKVTRDSNGLFKAHPWRSLPGYPTTIALTDKGDLFVGTTIGDILLSADGGMKMADCSPIRRTRVSTPDQDSD